MLIIPAIDIKNGQCVRLIQGQMNSETVFSNEPYLMAKKWEQKGAEYLHLVDLNGAIEKHPINLQAIEKIIKSVKIPVQIGGGIRNDAAVETYFSIGAQRVIIGTEAIRNPNWVKTLCQKYPDKIIVGIDARKGKVAIEGWTQTTETSAIDLARQYEDYGVAAIVFTDIEKDGMQKGPNIETTRQIAQSISTPVIASGGVTTLEDIKSLIPLSSEGITGAIIGRALYSGEIELEKALALIQQSNSGL